MRVSSPEAAELTKLLENIFRSVNIALVNELAMLTDRMGIDIWEVVDAAATKPYGFMRFEPGPGMGGHCLPVDPFYLSWRAREFDMTTEFIELAGKVNQQMPYHCVAKVERALNDAGLPVRGSRIAVLGVSYKPGVGDVRESPALKILSLLGALGAELVYHDPHVPELPELGLRSVPLEEALRDADLALIVTAHPTVDHEPRGRARARRGGPARGHARRGGGEHGAAVSLAPDPRAPGLLLGEGVEIGEGVSFGAYVVVHAGTVVGAGCVIEDHAVLGKRPRLARSSSAKGEVGRLELGERVTVCAGAVVFAGATIGEEAILGDQSFVRERSRVGPGSVIGRGSVVDNDVRVGARVKVQTGVYLTAGTVVEDDVFVGPGATHHQRRHDGPPRPDRATARSHPAPRLPRGRRHGAHAGRGDRRGGLRRRRRGRHPRCPRARGGDGGPRPCGARGPGGGPAGALALSPTWDAATPRHSAHPRRSGFSQRTPWKRAKWPSVLPARRRQASWTGSASVGSPTASWSRTCATPPGTTPASA